MDAKLAYQDMDKSFPLILVPIPLTDGKNWVLKKPFQFVCLINGELTTITAPRLMVTDFTSIPQIFQSIVGGPWGRYGKAAIIHDYLYQSGLYPRAISDQILRLGMQVSDVEKWREFVIYYAVRSGGWKSWGEHRKINKTWGDPVKFKQQRLLAKVSKIKGV